MGLFSSIASIGSFTSSTSSSEQSPKSMSKEHGFANFDADINRLRDYDPAAELEKAQ